MERPADFQERLLIDYITTRADRLLEEPQYTAITMRQSYQLDANYTLELRATATEGGFHGESEEDHQRYVYVSDTRQEPVPSFDLDGDSVEGTRQYFEPLDAIISTLEQQQPALAFFVRAVADAQNRLAADQEIPDALRHDLEIQLEAARRAERAAFGWPDVRLEHLRTIEKALRDLE